MVIKSRLVRYQKDMRVTPMTTTAQATACSSCLLTVTEDNLHSCGDCLNCCQCTWCKMCKTVIQSPPCDACGMCRKCCKCYACRTCGTAVTHKIHLCNVCGGCIRDVGRGIRGCCTAHKSNKEIIRTKRDVNLARYTPSLAELTNNTSPRLLSAEIEICGVKAIPTTLNSVLESWHSSVVGDGSLPSGGFEINTHPAGGDYWIAQIEDICGGLADAKAWVNQRAGCHTHVDARDFNYVDITKALRIIACVECGLYQMLPAMRRTSNYCEYWTPIYLQAIHKADALLATETNDRKITLAARSAVLRPLYSTDERESIAKYRKSKSSAARYRGVNLHSWQYRGTLEFRMPPGTIYPSNIINWGLLLGNIMDVAKGRSVAEVKSLTGEVEKYIEHNELYVKAIDSVMINSTFCKMSLDLLKNLCPTQEVRDWVIERVKAMKQVTGIEYTESY